MKIAVIAASGRAGSLIAKEALSRGHDVTAIVRDASKVRGMKVVEKDLLSLAADDLKDYDAVVDAFGTFDPGLMHLHMETLTHLCDILSGSPARLLVVGGAGSLYVDKSHCLQLYKTEGFPKEYVPVASAQVETLDMLKTRSDVKWTFLSPAAVFDAEGKRTGSYVLGGDELSVNQAGESYVSYADYAIAMVDEIEKASFVGKRFSVVAEKG